MSNQFFCNYHLIINSNSRKSLSETMERLNKSYKLFAEPSTIQPYHKDLNKTEVFGYIELPPLAFDDVLMWLCRHFHSCCYSWHISGDFDREIVMSAQKSRESTICFINFTLTRWGS